MARIREARYEDHAGVAALEERYGLFSTPEADWRWRWESNPAIQDAPAPWPLGWVIETEANDIAGFFGNVPMAYEIDGKRLLAAATNSWVVDDDHRPQALELLGRFFAQSTVDLFLSTTANPATTAAMTAFKAKKVPQPDCDEVLFWVTGPSGFARALATKSGWPMATVLGSLVGPWFGMADAARRRLSGNALEATPQGQHLATLGAFDERFDAFWQRLSGASGTLRFVRDRESLNWHFKRFLSEDRAWIAISEKAGALTGYAVFVRQDNAAIGLRRAVLADLQADGNNVDVLQSLLLAGLAESRARHLDVLEVVGFSSAKRHVLKGLAPWRRRLPTWPYLYKARKAPLADRLKDPACWDAGPIDGDASL